MSNKTNGAAEEIERENSLVMSWVYFIIFFVFFAAAIYVFSFATLEIVWPFAVSIVLVFLAFFIPMGLMGRSDTGKGVAVPVRPGSHTSGH